MNELRAAVHRRIGSAIELVRVHAPACLIALVAFAACRDAGQASSPAPARSDSAGVEWVQHGALAAYPAHTQNIHEPEYLLTVGEVQGPPELLFGEVGDAVLLSDGTLAVLDRHAAQVRLFSTEGDFIRSIGRQGEGPGEFSGGPGTLAVLPLASGGFAVPDLLKRSIAVFAATGELRTTYPFPRGEASLGEWRILLADTVVVRSSGVEGDAFIARSLDGSWQDTLAVVDRIELQVSAADPRIPLLPDHRVWAASGTGTLVVGRMTRPELMVYRNGRLVRQISWAGQGRVLSQADVDALYSIVLRQATAEIGAARARQVVRDRMAPPERAHAIADVEIGPRGMIMVQRLRPIEDMDRRILAVFRAEGFGGRKWDVFSASGAYLGVLDFGENVEVFHVQGDTIVGVREGELGVSRVFLARFPESLLRASEAS